MRIDLQELDEAREVIHMELPIPACMSCVPSACSPDAPFQYVLPGLFSTTGALGIFEVPDLEPLSI